MNSHHMDIRIRKDEMPAEGLRRIAIALNDQAVQHLKKQPDPHQAVHELRKRFKEQRALLRLLRFALGEELYKEENKFYRNLGRKISDIRDAKAFQESLTILKELYGIKLYKNALQKTESFLQERVDQMVSELGLQDLLINIQNDLQEHKIKINSWPIKIKNFKILAKGIHKVYDRGYKMKELLKTNPSVEGYHEWRKRAKYMRYQMEMLNFIWPDMMKAHEKSFHRFSDLTGDDHDFALLVQLIEVENPDEEEVKLLSALANGYRTGLQKEFIELGEKIFLEEPDQFMYRISKYWDLHEKSYTERADIPQPHSNQ